MPIMEIHANETSTVRMKKGEPHVTIWFHGPKGGHTGMMRLDRAEATKLAKALTSAVRQLNQQETKRNEQEATPRQRGDRT